MDESRGAALFIEMGGGGDPSTVADDLARLSSVVAESLPKVAIPHTRFVGELATRSAERGLAAVSDEGATELALACACAEQDPAALALFEARYTAVIGPALAHMKLDAAVVADITQAVRNKLLVADTDGEVKIVRYAGGGSLRGLVKVTAVRTAISHLRKEQREPRPSEDLDRLAEQTDNPELSFLKSHYRQAFAEAFEHAVTTLQGRERNVLRLHLLGGMTLEEVARMYSVDRSTIVRTLQRARKRLLVETRRQLGTQLGVDKSELDSVVALIRSRLDVSLGRLLQTVTPDVEEPP